MIYIYNMSYIWYILTSLFLVDPIAPEDYANLLTSENLPYIVSLFFRRFLRLLKGKKQKSPTVSRNHLCIFAESVWTRHNWIKHVGGFTVDSMLLTIHFSHSHRSVQMPSSFSSTGSFQVYLSWSLNPFRSQIRTKWQNKTKISWASQVESIEP